VGLIVNDLCLLQLDLRIRKRVVGVLLNGVVVLAVTWQLVRWFLTGVAILAVIWRLTRWSGV